MVHIFTGELADKTVVIAHTLAGSEQPVALDAIGEVADPDAQQPGFTESGWLLRVVDPTLAEDTVLETLQRVPGVEVVPVKEGLDKDIVSRYVGAQMMQQTLQFPPRRVQPKVEHPDDDLRYRPDWLWPTHGRTPRREALSA